MKPLDHTNPNNYPNDKCKCNDCRLAHNARHREYARKKAKEYVYDPDSSKHGKSSEYTQGCRCGLCKKTRTLEARVRREYNKKHQNTPDSAHGTLNGYSYWGCRCDPCVKFRREDGWRRAFQVEPPVIYALLENCGGSCSICEDPFENGNFQVDHCHTSGKVRGLLCKPCNMGLGNFKDGPERLTRAIEYLERTTS